MIKKIILIFVVSLCLLSGVNAVLDDAEAYWTLDNVLTDSTGNGHTLTNNGATYTASGKINGAYDFDGINDDLNSALTINNNAFSISVWINSDVAQNSQVMGDWDGANNRVFLQLRNDGTNFIRFAVKDGTTQSDADYTIGATNGQWYHLVGTYDGTNTKIYVDGILRDTTTGATGTITTTNGIHIGTALSTSWFDGQIDEPTIYSRALSTSEISELYNSGVGFNPYAIPEVTPTINHNTQDYYNTQNISIYLNTSTNTNMSYYLDLGSEISICNDCNSTTLNLTELSEGLHNITFISTDENGQENSTTIFTIDLTNPIINNNILAEYNSYTIEGFNSSCNDTNLNYCNISLNSQNVTLNITSFTFTENGNISYTITAEDLAGNTITENGTIFINPYQYFRFEKDATYLTDYVFNNQTWATEYASIKLYDLGLGSHTITFSKLGYLTTDFNITLTTTSDLNTTYSINPASVVLRIYDKDDNSLITGTNFDVEFIGNIGFSTSTSTGILNITNTFVNEDSFRVIITNPDYLSESIFFDYDARSLVEIEAHMLHINNTNLGYVTIQTLDGNGQIVAGATIFAKQWDSTESSFITVSQATTGVDGKAIVNIILEDKLYKFAATKDALSAETDSLIITGAENGKTISLTLDEDISARSNFVQDLLYSVTEEYNEITNISLITINWESSTGLPVEICLNKYRYIYGSEKYLDGECFTGIAEEKYKAFYINTSQDMILKVAYKDDAGILHTLKSFAYNSNANPVKILENLGLSIIIVPLLFMVAIGIGLASKNIFIGTILLILMSGLSLSLVPSVLTGAVVAFCAFIGVMILLGGNKQ